MTASGPFAMGPSAMSGSSSSHSALRTNTTNAPSPRLSAKHSGELTNTAAPKLQSSISKVKEEEEVYQEAYSDPEEAGVEIVDMNLVKQMDWSAPEILRRSSKTIAKIKKEVKETRLKKGIIVPASGIIVFICSKRR